MHQAEKCPFFGSNLCRLFLQSSLLVLGVHQLLFGQQQLFIQGVCLLLSLTHAQTHTRRSLKVKLALLYSQFTSTVSLFKVSCANTLTLSLSLMVFQFLHNCCHILTRTFNTFASVLREQKTFTYTNIQHKLCLAHIVEVFAQGYLAAD